MTKTVDGSNLGYLIGKIRAAFWAKGDTSELTIDATPTSASDNLVKSGGVYSFVRGVGGAMPVGGFLPDVVYELGTLSGTVTFALAATVAGNINHYFWTFETGVSAPTVNWPAGLTWADGSAPTPGASKHCEVSVLGGVATYMEV